MSDLIDFVSEEGREGERERERVLICLIISLNGCNGHSWARQKLRGRHFISGSLRNGEGPNAWAIFCYFSQVISRKLTWKWSSSSRDLNRYSSGVSASQEAYWCAMPQCQYIFKKIFQSCSSLLFLNTCPYTVQFQYDLYYQKLY